MIFIEEGRAFYKRIVSGVFGTVQWQRPAWMTSVGRGVSGGHEWIKLNPRRFALIAMLIILGAGGIVAGRYWYKHRPRPVEVALHVVPPGLTTLEDEKWKILPLVIKFDGSVAPLAEIGNSPAHAPEVSPSIDGTWNWTNDHELSFQPKADWPVGEAFTVTIPKKGFIAPHTRLADYEVKFSTAPFTAAVDSAEFYQDPTDPALKQVVATIKFSHPVDVDDFEKHLAVYMEKESEAAARIAGDRARRSVTYDKFKLNAYVRSTRIPIPPSDTSMWISILPGIHAARGGEPTDKKIDRQVSIPGLYSFLRVESANLTLVNNDRNEPEQVLVLETTASVHENQVGKNISAWILPIHNPDPKLDNGRQPYAWTNPSIISPDILRISEPLPLQQIPNEKEYTTLHSFHYKAEVGRYVYVRLNRGITSFGGYVLGRTFDSIERVPEFPRELRILSQGSILSLSGEKKVPLYARDVDGVRFEVGRLLPDQLQHLVTQTSGDFQHPDFSNYNFNQDNVSERFTETRALPPQPHGTSQYLAFDFTKYLEAGSAGEGRRGVFFFKVEGWDPVNQNVTGGKDSRVIIVTDLGVLVKDAVDGSHDVFVESIADGQPVGGAKVDVIGVNGMSVLSATTEADGHVHFPTFHDFKREQTPALYLVRKGGDTSFLPYNRHDRNLNLSRFDIGGVANAASPDRLSAYLFSDRGIYRPGDEFRIGIIVKPTDWSQKTEGIPVEEVVTDARGLVVKRERIRLSASGFEELRYTTDETSPTGTYSISLYIVKDNETGGLLGSTSVRVQEFLPDRLKISAHFSREVVSGWVSPDDLKGLVTLRNLFGTPAADRRIAASITLSPAYPAFAAFGSYSFYDPIRAKETYTEDLKETTTDENGAAALDLNLQHYGRATYRLRFFAQGFEAGSGRGVSAESSILVSPMPYLIGFKADGDLHYVNKGSKRSVELIAISPDAHKTAVPGLTLALAERKFVSVLTKQANGTFKYESVRRERVINSAPMAIPEAGIQYPLPTANPGDYALLLRDDHGTELNRIEYSVTGAGNLSLSLEKNAELSLALNKADYVPGEKIELQIKAPYAGAGLITIERDRVVQYKWFKTPTTATVQTIELPKSFEGNGYVCVSFIRDIASDEIFTSPLSYGVAPFSVSRNRRTAKIAMRAPDLAKPGEPFRMRYRTERPSRIVLFAIDEGILQVAHYQRPDPLGFFFQKRALEVQTSQILDLIIPEFKRLMALAAPGGDAGGAIGKNLNPFKRKRDKPVAYWSGIIDAGPKEQELVYPIPDSFNGTLHLFAVAVSPDAVGVFEKSSQVRGDFVINPNVPTFVAPGDDFVVSVSVANNIPHSGVNAPVSVALETSEQLEVVGPKKATVAITEMREGTASFHLRARPRLGSASLAFTSTLGAHSSHFSTSLSVRPAVPYMMTLSSGMVRKGSEEVPVTRRMYPEYRTMNAGISHLPLFLAGGLLAYLEKVPYGCTEQLVSQAFPAVVLRDRPEFGFTPGVAEKAVLSAMTTLQGRQNADGAFGLWAANPNVSDFATAYATHFLLDAKERGFPVSREMIESAMKALNELASRQGNGLADERVRSYAIYLLTRNGVVTSNYATALQGHLEEKWPAQWKKDLAGIYLAATYQMLKQERMAGNLIKESKLGDPQSAELDDYYFGPVRDAQLLYVLARHFPDRLRIMSSDSITALTDPIKRGEFNTLSSAYTIIALDAYARAIGVESNGELAITETAADGTKQVLPLPKGLFPRVAIRPDDQRVRFTSSGDFASFYQLTQGGFDVALPQKAITSKLEILRQYTALGGGPLQHAKLGDEIEVHLRLRTISGQHAVRVAVTDLLPGGFEVVEESHQPAAEAAPATTKASDSESNSSEEGEDNTAAPTAPAWVSSIRLVRSTWQIEYSDVREDRVVLYGEAGPEVKEFIYKIKPTNVGTYTVPPAFGEAMYNREVQARSAGARIVVEPH
jgi:uncharacterized protein YfaS (alpha-2-macroglobulin family)